MERRILTFTANEQILIKTSGIEYYASNIVEYIEAHFELGDNWSGYDSVRAVWYNDYATISTVLDSNGVCRVPYEVLTRTGIVKVNLVGSIADGDTLTDRLTTYPIHAVRVDKAARVTGDNASPVTPSEYEQFVAAVRADADRAEAGATSAETSAESASASAQSASTSASDAQTYAQNAQNYAVSAETAKDDAIDAKEDAESAKADAESARDQILGMRATANTLAEGSDATASYSNGLLTLGIPRGNTGAKGDKGDKGDTGATPNLSIGTVETLPPTGSSEVTITGTAENPVLNFKLVKGDTGEVAQAEFDEAVTDLKSDLYVSTGNQEIPLTAKNAYIDLSGSSVPMSEGVPQSSGFSATYNYSCVSCSEGDKFIINGTGGGQTRLWGFVSSSGEILLKSNASISGTNVPLTAPANSAFLIHHTNDSSKSYYGEYLLDSVNDLSYRMDADNTVEPKSYQLIDEKAYTHGAILDTGAVSTSGAWSEYDTSDFIPIKGGTTYSVYYADESGNMGTAPRIIYLICDINRKPLYHYNVGSPASGLVQFTPHGDGYARVSVAATSFHDKLLMLEGTTLKPYASYGKVFRNNIDFSASQKTAINGMIDEFVSGNKMSVSISSGVMELQSGFENGSIKHTYNVATNGGNGLPQFYKTEIYDSDGNLVGTKNEDDDIAPLRITYFETVGANHGYPFVYKITKSGQTSDDVGSIWTDGTTNYLLVNTDDSYAYFLAPAGIFGGNYRPNTDRPNADLTPVSGAVHQTTIPISGLQNGSFQLYPSVNNVKTSVIVDGNTISGDFTGIAEEVVIDNVYGIMSYADIWEYLPAHIGDGFSDSISDIVTVAVRTSFKANGKCTVTTTLIANDNVRLSDCGFLQAQAIATSSGQQLWRYINGLKPMSGNDFSKFINITSYSSNLVVSSSDFIDASVPPNRLTDWLIVSGNKVFGFALGYVADLADSSNAKRLTNCANNRFWDIRSTKKIYPIALNGITLSAGESVTVCGYRNYLTPSEFVNENVFEYGDAIYAGLDDNSSGTKIFGLDGKYVGRTITVIDGTNATAENEVVSIGVIESLTDAGGCLVKLT